MNEGSTDIQATNSQILQLLKSGLYGRPIPESELPDRIEWNYIVRLAKKHFVLGIIIESIQFLPERLKPSGASTDKMVKFALGLINTNMALDRTAARLSTFLSQHGIEGVLLKGQGVARSYYSKPQMRQCGDIDFYVGRENYRKAIELCKENLMDSGSKCHETEKHFHFVTNGLIVELHRIAGRLYMPLWNKRFLRISTEELQNSPQRRRLPVGDTEIVLPSYNYDALFIFHHAWYHFFQGGIGLRQLCDFTMIFHSHSNDIDTARLCSNIKRLGLTGGWRTFASIAVDYLGLSADKMPLYSPKYKKKGRKALDKIIDGGNFGFYSKANRRTPILGYGLWHGLGKFRNLTEYFFSIFKMNPLEATFYYFDQLFHGIIRHSKRSASAKKRLT